MAPIGKRIRDVERALRRCVPEKEEGLRETLAALQLEKKANEKKLREKANSQKYHLVKFVERQKICRRVHKVDKALQSVESKSEKKALVKQREALLEDLTYVMYYPMTMKYIGMRKLLIAYLLLHERIQTLLICPIITSTLRQL